MGKEIAKLLEASGRVDLFKFEGWTYLRVAVKYEGASEANMLVSTEER